MKPSASFRRWLGRVHLWLGLASGVLVFLISLSGALYAFRDELFDFFHRDVLYLREAPETPPLPLSTLLERADSALGARGAKARWLTTYSDPRRTWQFRAYEETGSGSPLTYFQEVRHDLLVYVNPYTGAIAGVIDHEREFFQVVKMFHWSFLLANDIGQPIVGYSVAVFVLMLVSGLILWWPKRLRQVPAKLRIPWSAGWKSKFYALHSALGAIVFPVALVIALTGLFYAFRIVQTILYVAIALTTAPPDFDLGRSRPEAAESRPLALDAVFEAARERHPRAYSIGYGLPEAGDDSATIYVWTRDNPMVYFRGSRESYDRHSGAFIKGKSFETASRGEKYLAMNYDIHVGAVLGLPGKILAFCASLICASLPVTGFLVWRGREKRRKTPKTQPENTP